MGPTKAPGPDGFPVMFYQKHWAMLGVTFVMRSELFSVERMCLRGCATQ
jgi:hypothetical protein